MKIASKDLKRVTRVRPPRMTGVPLRAHLTTHKFPVELASECGQLRAKTYPARRPRR